MKSTLIIAILSLATLPAIAATNSAELIKEINTALDHHDKAAFEKCVNFEGADKVTKDSFNEFTKDIYSWPTHYVSISKKLNDGWQHFSRDGKNYSANGTFTDILDIFISKPPSKGIVLPAGYVGKKYMILLGVENK
jgi:hypothetical protein